MEISFTRCCCCLPIKLGQNLIGLLMSIIWLVDFGALINGTPQTAWKDEVSVIDYTMWILITMCAGLFVWEKVRTWADRNTESVRYNRFTAQWIYAFANTIRIWVIAAYDWQERGMAYTLGWIVTVGWKINFIVVLYLWWKQEKDAVVLKAQSGTEMSTN